MTTASTSAWVWDSRYSLYYNATTRQWASPQADGSWRYFSEAGQANEHGAGHSGTLEEGQIEGDVPEEQVWPGIAPDDDDEDPQVRIKAESFAAAPLLRLVVQSAEPTVLSQQQKVAVLDPAEPVSIGRDRSHDRRIRLRELAVSKDHATLFWTVDETTENRGFWAVVDIGSTHGTFIKGDGEKREARLSDAKSASSPSRLHHLDTLRCGSTSFKIHIHPSFACSACTVASDSSNIIPLLPIAAAESGSSKVPAAYHTKTKEEKEFERREQLKGLKDKFLKPSKLSTPRPPKAESTTSRHPGSSRESSASFVDRAAARRARDVGTVASRASTAKSAKPACPPFFSVPGVTSSSTFFAPPSATTKADPFSSDSKGAQLLSKLGGGPSGGGSTAPVATTPTPPRPGLGTLIEARTFDKSVAGAAGGREARPGLGSRPLVAIDQVGQAASSDKRDWREDVREASRKRFKEMG